MLLIVNLVIELVHLSGLTLSYDCAVGFIPIECVDFGRELHPLYPNFVNLCKLSVKFTPVCHFEIFMKKDLKSTLYYKLKELFYGAD